MVRVTVTPDAQTSVDEATAAGAEPGENGPIVQKFITLPQQCRHGLRLAGP